jgi:hypothetical protein
VFDVVIATVFILHWLACIWAYMGGSDRLSERADKRGSTTWLQNVGYLGDEPSAGAVYAVSYYFAVVVCATIGFGDILPTNSIERSVTCVFLIFGTVIFSSILASFTVLMQVP